MLTPKDFPSSEEILSREFVDSYRNKPVPWGFNGLGYVVYKRTYARTKPDGTTEEWYETIERCIRGLQKIGACYTKQEAKTLFDKVFNLKCCFSGRGLWQLGTPTVDLVGMDSLLNCWGTKISSIDDLIFVLTESFLGGGVGCNVSREYTQELPRVKRDVSVRVLNTKDADYIIPDSKEGWCEFFRRLLEAYLITGKSFTASTYCIRNAGEPIKTFGGIAPGPKPLIDATHEICAIFEKRSGKKLRTEDVCDIITICGQMIKSGGVRRTALILGGDPDDIGYLNLKRWDLDTIPNYRSNSNNSILCPYYSYISPRFWEGYRGNGEAYGLLNLRLSRKIGRLGETSFDGFNLTDESIIIFNPCISENTNVLTDNGYKLVKDLVNTNVNIVVDSDIIKTSGFFKTDYKELFKLKTKDGHCLDCTEDHKIAILLDNSIIWKEARYITENDKIVVYNHTNPKQFRYSYLDSIDSIGYQDVYDITVPDKHCFYANNILVHNCGEATLADKECCNLAELVINNISSLEEMIECALLIYKGQKAIAGGRYLHDATNKIVHKNMRLGMSITGICQRLDVFESWSDNTYRALRKFDKEWSNQRGWPQSIRLTTEQPSGTKGLMFGSTPGGHPGYSEFFIRRIRFSSNDPLIGSLKKLGYHTEYEIRFDGSYNHDIVVIDFPCKFDSNTQVADKNFSAIHQLELVKSIQKNWADQAVSVTVYYKPDELSDIQKWLSENYDNNIKSVSFLLHQDHNFKQAPYEAISESKYMELLSSLESLSTLSITTDGEMTNEECAGGVCPVR